MVIRVLDYQLCSDDFSEDRLCQATRKAKCFNERCFQLTFNCSKLTQLQKPRKSKFGNLMWSYANNSFISNNFPKKQGFCEQKP